MYKILIKYIPSNGIDRHMWITHGSTTITTTGNRTTETFEEFVTDDSDVLKAEVIKLYETYGTDFVKVVDEIDIEHEIFLIDAEEKNVDTGLIHSTTMSLMNRNTVCLGKNVSDLIGDDIIVKRDGSVHGTLKHVTNFTDFSSKKSEQSGHYFPFVLGVTGSKMTIKKNGTASADKKDMAFDREIILRVDKTDTVFTIEVDGKKIISLNFINVILE